VQTRRSPFGALLLIDDQYDGWMDNDVFSLSSISQRFWSFHLDNGVFSFGEIWL
jgi:hypothetical protein